MKIFSGTTDQKLTKKICDQLEKTCGCELGPLRIDKFSDGEILPMFKESIRDEDVFFVQSTVSPESILETLLVIDAAKRAGCKSFTLISPYMGYSRQDKTDHLRSSIGSKVLADILEKVGMTRIITIDLHASSIQGFYNVPVVHLNGNKVFVNYVKSLHLEDLCILAPDQGAVRRASNFMKAFPASTFAMVNKKRIKPNEIHSMELVGDVVGKNVIIVDDLIDTGGTLKKAAELVMSCGAKSVRAIATHGVLSGPAFDNINSSVLEELIISDSIPQNTDCKKLRVVSCDKLVADVVNGVLNKKSISEINTVVS